MSTVEAVGKQSLTTDKPNKKSLKNKKVLDNNFQLWYNGYS